MSDQEEWTEVERARLASLDDSAEPPAGLERRVVDALRARGVIVPVRGAWRKQLAAVAAGILLFVGGVWAGRQTAAPAVEPDSAMPRFALFFYSGETPMPDEEEGALVEEYGHWARGLSERGNLASGEKLKPGALFLPSKISGSGLSPESLEGFFLIDARSEDEAEAIARTCPHLRHGGVVAVRAVDPT